MISSVSLSGMAAARLSMDVTAGNIAHWDTPDWTRQAVSLAARPDSGGVSATVQAAASGGPAPIDDVVSLLAERNSFLANLAVFRRSREADNALLALV